MKVIQVMPNFLLAGAEIMCENLVYALKDKGVDVTVVSFYDQKSAITERLEANGIDVRYLGKKRGLDLSIVSKLRKIYKEIKPDAIHTHRYALQYSQLAAMFDKSVVKVHTVHSIATKEFGKAKRKVAKWCYKRKGVVPVAISEVVRESIASEYGLKSEDIPLVYNGIDLGRCLPKSDYTRNGAFRIFHVGRFAYPKNHSMLIRAFSRFHSIHSDSKLVLVGDGEGKSEIEALIKELSLEGAVELMGLQENVPSVISNADVLTLPSVYEGMPMTLIEAMGTALPIAATAVGGVPDMLVNGESAILTEVDEIQLANAFSELYESEQLREKYGRAALAASVRFSSSTMAQKYISIYKGEI